MSTLTNRFESTLVDFYSVYNSESNATDVNIGIERNDPSIMGSGLEQALNVMMNSGDRQIFEPVECSKYTLDGNQACSVI